MKYLAPSSICVWGFVLVACWMSWLIEENTNIKWRPAQNNISHKIYMVCTLYFCVFVWYKPISAKIFRLTSLALGMMTSSNRNLFRATGPLWGEFTSPRSPVNSPHKGQWRGALMFSFICVWINGWVNNLEAGNLRRYRVHYDTHKACMPWLRLHTVKCLIQGAPNS